MTESAVFEPQTAVTTLEERTCYRFRSRHETKDQHDTPGYTRGNTRRRSGGASLSADETSGQTSGSFRGYLPDHRFCAFKLHQFSAQAHLCPDAVQIRFSGPSHSP